MRLRCAGEVIEADDSLVTLAGDNGWFEQFSVTPAGTAPDLRLDRGPAAGGVSLPGPSGSLGLFEHQGDTVRVAVADDVLPALAALRLAFHLSAVRQGGLLVHGAGFTFGSRVIVATGASGAGKSTLARLCVDGGATLLSDEILILLPDGTCAGTPFRSDLASPSFPLAGELAGVLLLAHGRAEQLARVPESEMIAAVLSQVFRPPGAGLSTADALNRVANALARTRTERLTFRIDPSVPAFLQSHFDAAADR